jgi:hypothetical protein
MRPYNSRYGLCEWWHRDSHLTSPFLPVTRRSGHGGTSSDIPLSASKVEILSPEIATHGSLKVETTTTPDQKLSDHANHPSLDALTISE